MARLDPTHGELHIKFAYMGPALSGRTTTLKSIYGRTEAPTKLQWLPGPEETSVLGFSFVPQDLGKIGSFRARFHVMTAPGHQWYGHGRQACLEHADAVVFVADSQTERTDATLDAMEDVRELLGSRITQTPIVLQLNKRDLPDIVPVDELRQVLDPEAQYEAFESVAVTGEGCFAPLKQAARAALLALKRG